MGITARKRRRTTATLCALVALAAGAAVVRSAADSVGAAAVPVYQCFRPDGVARSSARLVRPAQPSSICQAGDTLKSWTVNDVTPPATTTTSLLPTTTTSVVTTTTQSTGTNAPPPAGGYFTLKAVGATLPNDCAGQVHRSTWEPRPFNNKRNHTPPDPAAVQASFVVRPYDSGWRNWNTMLQRVDGQFVGTTDEIFQWAACKWGLPDNVLRGIAVRESTWYQYLTYPSGRCVLHYSCGDFFATSNADSTTYCNHIDTFGYRYQLDHGAGICPKTFSIVGVMSWENPSWRAPYPPFQGNQNGAFPFNRNSTAFAVDYIGAYLYGCYQGNIRWLNTSGGDLWGCVGSWYAGDWHSSEADGYIGRVQNEIANLRWLQPGWPTDKPGCDSFGCPGPDVL